MTTEDDPFTLPENPTETRTYIAIVLDRSGSMASMQQQTIDGFNKFVADQKKLPIKATLTLAQFDHEYEIIHDAIDLQSVPKLDDATYVPRGNTALFDAIGRSVMDTRARLKRMDPSERPTQIIFVIITDGGENHSVEFKSHKQVADLIAEARGKHRWEFVFIGSDEAGLKQAEGILRSAGMRANIGTYGAQSKRLARSSRARGATGQSVGGNVGEAYVRLSNSMSSYRSDGNALKANFLADPTTSNPEK